MKITTKDIRSASTGVELRDFETAYIHFDNRNNSRPPDLVIGFRHKPSGDISMLRFIRPSFGKSPALPFLGDEVYSIVDNSSRGWEAGQTIEFGRIAVGDHQMIRWWAEDIEDDG